MVPPRQIRATMRYYVDSVVLGSRLETINTIRLKQRRVIFGVLRLYSYNDWYLQLLCVSYRLGPQHLPVCQYWGLLCVLDDLVLVHVLADMRPNFVCTSCHFISACLSIISVFVPHEYIFCFLHIVLSTPISLSFTVPFALLESFPVFHFLFDVI